MCDELPWLVGGAYPAHWKPARVALPTCTVHMKAIAKKDFHYYACEYNFAKNTVIAEVRTPAFREGLIKLLDFAPVADVLITSQPEKDKW